MGRARFLRDKKWHKGELWALALLLIGLVLVLVVAATEGEYLVWTMWIAIPMLMFSLAYLFLVSAIPIFLGPVPSDRAEEKKETEDDR